MKSRVEDKLTSVGVAGPGRDWVIRALDPATTGPAPGIPDTSSKQVLRPEFNFRCSIQAPATTTSTWDAYLFFPPGDQNVVVWATAPSNTPVDFSAPVASTPTGAAFGTCLLQPYTDLPGNTTFDIMNNGTPAIALASVRAPASLPAAFRSQYRSHTIELSAADLSNQGEVYAGQFPLEVRASRFQNCGSTTSATSGNVIGVVADYVPLPMNEADLALACRNAYVGRAKDGVYMPIRLSGPTQPFSQSPTPQSGSWNATPLGGLVNREIMSTYGPTVQWPRVLLACQNDTSGQVASAQTNMLQTDTWINLGYQNVSSGDTGYDNAMVGVVIFRGLSGCGGGGGGGGGPSFTASLIIKSLIGLEVVPRPTSIDRVFQKPAAMYNPRALEAYYAVANELAPAFPASANSLGGLLPILASAASFLWPAVKAGAAGLRTSLADSLAPYASGGAAGAAPRERIVVREKIEGPRSATRASSVRSRVSMKSIKSTQKKRRPKARVSAR